MKMKIRTCVLLTVLCLCFVLTACGKTDPITVPAADDIVSITVTNGEESIAYDDTEWISKYIMVLYGDFTGAVELRSAYDTSGSYKM